MPLADYNKCCGLMCIDARGYGTWVTRNAVREPATQEQQVAVDICVRALAARSGCPCWNDHRACRKLLKGLVPAGFLKQRTMVSCTYFRPQAVWAIFEGNSTPWVPSRALRFDHHAWSSLKTFLKGVLLKAMGTWYVCVVLLHSWCVNVRGVYVRHGHPRGCFSACAGASPSTCPGACASRHDSSARCGSTYDRYVYSTTGGVLVGWSALHWLVGMWCRRPPFEARGTVSR